MSQTNIETFPRNVFGLEVIGTQNEACQHAISEALEILDNKLPPVVKELVHGSEITIASDLIESGGLTKAEEKKIILDTEKNTLSLQAAENFLVEAGYLRADDWTKALPSLKDHPWSCLTYQLIHEFGHLIDGQSNGKSYERLNTDFSPTKYGETSSLEAFAEAFAYWVLDQSLVPEAQQAVEHTLFSAL
jgi:hypothetical protein